MDLPANCKWDFPTRNNQKLVGNKRAIFNLWGLGLLLCECSEASNGIATKIVCVRLDVISLAHCYQSTLSTLFHVCLPYTVLYRTCSLTFPVYVVILTLLNLCLVQGGVGEGGRGNRSRGNREKVL